MAKLKSGQTQDQNNEIGVHVGKKVQAVYNRQYNYSWEMFVILKLYLLVNLITIC